MNLSKRQTKALLASIRHWYRVRDEGIAALPFPLCSLYIWASCRTCPVAIAAGSYGCLFTPYVKYRDYVLHEKRGHVLSEFHRLFLAQKEINFLASLLPDGVEPPEDPQKKGR